MTLCKRMPRSDADGVETEFEDAIRGLHATGASHSAHKIVEALDRHGREEGELLERYQRFGEESESPWVRYLVKLVLEDERRHHRLLEDLANTIAWEGVSGSLRNWCRRSHLETAASGLQV